MIKETLENVRRKTPLIHCITNYVTVNDVANALLACGGSPIMADDAAEVEEITSICTGLCINIGTLNSCTVESMLLAGKKAKELGHTVVLDPVGAGASRLRTESALKIIKEVRPNIIRGNISEIKALAVGISSTRGVDADVSDAVTEENLSYAVEFIKSYAESVGAIVAVTGQLDLVTDGVCCYVIRNGREEMSKITGTGCQLSAIVAAYAAANPKSALEATAAAVCLMGISGEQAYAEMSPRDGNSTYRNRIIDAICNLNGDTLEKEARYEIR